MASSILAHGLSFVPRGSPPLRTCNVRFGAFANLTCPAISGRHHRNSLLDYAGLWQPSARVLYTALDMSSTRTQVYLTEEQRRRLDQRGRHEGRSMAAVVRDAVDAYLAAGPDPDTALDSTFGSLPNLAVPPRDEWARG